MIKAKYNWFFCPLFKWLSSFLVKRNFCFIHFETEFNDDGHSVLAIANHISWWDGFWIEYLNLKKIHRRFNFMMSEDQLKKHWYFQQVGGYSVRKNSRELIQSIAYTAELLNNDQNMVLIFPQGEIHSAHNTAVRFKKGIQYIIKKVKNDTQVLFVVNITDYFSEAKPHLFIYTKKFSAGFFKDRNIEEEYNLFFNEVLNSHKTKTS